MNRAGNGQLCRSVEVFDNRIGSGRLPFFSGLAGQRLASEEAPAECGQSVRPQQIAFTHLRRYGRHGEPYGQLVLVDETARRDKIDRRHGIDAGARFPGHKQIEDRKIEGLIKGLREAVLGSDLIAIHGPIHECAHIGVNNRHALGDARGSRGKQQIGDAIRGQRGQLFKRLDGRDASVEWEIKKFKTVRT